MKTKVTRTFGMKDQGILGSYVKINAI